MTNSLVAELNARSERPDVRPSANRRALLALAGITLLGAGIQLWGLDFRAFHGDEFGSIREARDFGSNPQALVYFALLRLWLGFGESEAWLRGLSAVFGVAAIPLTYWLARQWLSRSSALVAATLIATSAYKVYYGEEIRFYSLFVCATLLSMIAMAMLLRSHSRFNVAFWILTALLCAGSHAMSALILAAEAITLLVFWRQQGQGRRLITVIVVSFMSLLALLIPSVREAGFNFVTRYTNATDVYSASRGLDVTQLAKAPIAFFQFAFGPHVYPLTYGLTIPGSVLVAATITRGIYFLRSRREALFFVAFAPCFSIVLLFLLFDSLATPGLQGASARYLIFLLPLLYVVAAAGMTGRWRIPLFVSLIAVNAVTLGFHWYGDWSPEGDLTDWREAGAFVRTYQTENTAIVVDGRAAANARVYLPTEIAQRSAWDYANGKPFGDLTDHSRVVFVSYDDRPDVRRTLNDIHDRLSEQYTEIGAWVQYPLFVSIYDRKPTPGPALGVDAGTGVVSLPREVYGLEFQDLRLPAQAWVDGRSIPITGAVSIPAPNGARERVFRVANDTPSRSLLILSNLTEAAAIPRGADVATVTLTGADGSVVTQALRNGVETADWGAACDPTSGCRVAYSWHKRIVLVGRRAFNRAWDDFPARIFSTRLPLTGGRYPRVIQVQYTASVGRLHIWSVAVEQ